MFRVIIIMLVFAGCGRKLWQAPDPNVHAAAVVDLVEAARVEANATAAVARVQTPKGTLTFFLGQEKTGGPDVSAFHRFGIRDITGALIATAVLMLVQDNALVLTDPVNKFIPSAPEGVTLTHLLAMRSGIPDFSRTTFPPDQVTTGFDLAAAIDMTPTFEPDARFEYSRTNSLLLGEVITSVTGKQWHDFLRERMLEPLKLFRTEFPAGTTPSQPFAASTPISFSQFQGAGGLASTAEELETLAKPWLRALSSLRSCTNNVCSSGRAKVTFVATIMALASWNVVVYSVTAAPGAAIRPPRIMKQSRK